jgi:predicted membrane-bound mannosyltransferase
MAEGDRLPGDEWQLDERSSDRAEHEARLPLPTTALAGNLSHERLTRGVYVVTAENLGWGVVAVYALITRAIALGARPLDAVPATDALAAFLIAAHGRVAFALAGSWVTIVESWIFAASGATDASSRIVVMLCGLLMIATAFAMRPVLGRAGALAFAALIAISPGMTYFARGGSTVIASLTFMMVAIAIAESMRRRPSVARAAWLGVAIALWLTADSIGYVTAAAVAVSLILVGLADAVRLDHPRLRIRVWWQRRRLLVIVCASVAIILWSFLATAFMARSFGQIYELELRPAFAPPSIAVHRAVRRLVPILVAYEFILPILAIVGTFAIVSRRVGDGFAAWSVVWAFVSLAILASVSANSSNAVVAIALPLSILGAYAVDWLHQSERWNSIRYALVAAAALTLYVQIGTNFVHPAPDTSEAPWRRHALLFWSEPVTSTLTKRECERARDAVTVAGATAMIPDDAPQVQWYLRDLAPTGAPETANIVVTMGRTSSGAIQGDPDVPHFGFEEWWTPDFRTLTASRAIDHFFTQRAWSDVEISDIEIAIPRPDTKAPPP